MRHAVKIAAFTCASLALGSLVARGIPTQISTTRNAEFERLSEAKPVSYPGQDRVIAGQDSYNVTYSPRWLAVTEKAERARRAKWALPEVEPVGYDQPSPELDLAAERGPADSNEPAYSDERTDEETPEG